MATKSRSRSKSPRRIEAAIQRALVGWLRENYPHVRIIATLNENNRHCMDMGCEVGAPDLVLMWGCSGVENILDLELKTKAGERSDVQVEWERNRHALSNAHYAVAYGFEEAKKICIDKFGYGAMKYTDQPNGE